MTKEEAKKMLTNTKVYVNGKSKEIQEKLFKIGFSCIVNNAHYFPFIYLNDDFYLRVDKDMVFFKEHHFREVSAEDILNIKIDEEIKKEHKFKPFDRVLVRYEEDENWRINLYGRKDTGMDAPYPYKCIFGDWSFCIPYEGNESLLGTSNSPGE